LGQLVKLRVDEHDAVAIDEVNITQSELVEDFVDHQPYHTRTQVNGLPTVNISFDPSRCFWLRLGTKFKDF